MPIPGARSITHLEENAAAVDVALDPADVDAVEAIFSATSVQGARYYAPRRLRPHRVPSPQAGRAWRQCGRVRKLPPRRF